MAAELGKGAPQRSVSSEHADASFAFDPCKPNGRYQLDLAGVCTPCVCPKRWPSGKPPTSVHWPHPSPCSLLPG